MIRTVQAAVVSAILLSVAAPAAAQITPDNVYFGARRAMPVHIERPEGKTGLPEIVIYNATNGEEKGRTPVDVGAADLNALAPNLMIMQPYPTYLVQLLVGGEPAGAPLVLQPMQNPMYAPRLDRAGAPAFPENPTRTFSGFRAYADKNIVIETTEGEMEFQLRPDVAPNTCWNFRQLVEGGFYTDILIHRIADLRGDGVPSVVQAGDPLGTGFGGPGYYIDFEPSTIPHDFGVLSTARSGDPNTAGSQFFICLNREGTQFLDGKYTTFGELVRGEETLRKLGATPVNESDRPVSEVRIVRAYLADARPVSERSFAEPAPKEPDTGR